MYISHSYKNKYSIFICVSIPIVKSLGKHYRNILCFDS